MRLEFCAIADGRLSNVPGTLLYTVPPNAFILLKNIRMVNTGGAATFNLYVNRTGVNRFIRAPNEAIGAGALAFFDISIPLEPGDTILGDANINNVVDFIFNGIRLVLP